MSTATPSELDALSDRVQTFQPRGAETPAQPEPQSWGLSIERIFEDSGLRLDAARFDPGVDTCMERLEALGLPLLPLTELADLSLPHRFERVWAADVAHGIPYLNATDLLSLFAVGLPTKSRFLSRKTNVDIDKLIVRKNWLLMTCSGTIGRIFHVPKRLDGWVATHDLIRIRPKTGMVGYLFAWCMTELAQAQILSHTHGGQIDHVTDEQVGQMVVPMLPKTEARALNREVLRALKARERGLAKLENLWPRPS